MSLHIFSPSCYIILLQHIAHWSSWACTPYSKYIKATMSSVASSGTHPILIPAGDRKSEILANKLVKECIAHAIKVHKGSIHRIPKHSTAQVIHLSGCVGLLKAITNEEHTMPTQSPNEAVSLDTVLYIKSLHQSMQPNANTYVLEFMKLLALQACQSETLSKFAIDTFTPHSAWFSLTFTALKQVTETPEFILLADTYTKDITEFQQLTKSRIVAVPELELFGYPVCHHQVDCWLHCISCQGFCYFWWQNKITGTTTDPPLHLHCSLS